MSVVEPAVVGIAISSVVTCQLIPVVNCAPIASKSTITETLGGSGTVITGVSVESVPAVVLL
jgi:hypothetical protein